MIPDLRPPRQFFGKYRGVVVRNDDPERRGRLQVKVPAVLGEASLNWALPCLPVAAPGAGVYLIPPVGAQVWIEYEAGDPEVPIWSGCFWAPNGIPAAPTPGTKVIRFGSAVLTLHNDPAPETIRLEVEKGGTPSKLEVSESALVLERGKAHLKISDAGVEIVVDGTTIKVTGTEIQLRSGAAGVQVTSAGGKVSVNNGALEVL